MHTVEKQLISEHLASKLNLDFKRVLDVIKAAEMLGHLRFEIRLLRLRSANKLSTDIS